MVWNVKASRFHIINTFTNPSANRFILIRCVNPSWSVFIMNERWVIISTFPIIALDTRGLLNLIISQAFNEVVRNRQKKMVSIKPSFFRLFVLFIRFFRKRKVAGKKFPTPSRSCCPLLRTSDRVWPVLMKFILILFSLLPESFIYQQKVLRPVLTELRGDFKKGISTSHHWWCEHHSCRTLWKQRAKN